MGMRNEMAYRRAFWTWFLERAGTPGPWGSRTIKREIREHLEACGIDAEKSQMPELGSITEWGNTENPNVTTSALRADYWDCNCGSYGGHNLLLFIGGELSIGEIIFEVIRKVDELDEQN
jgi:hypothetical protein